MPWPSSTASTSAWLWTARSSSAASPKASPTSTPATARPASGTSPPPRPSSKAPAAACAATRTPRSSTARPTSASSTSGSWRAAGRRGGAGARLPALHHAPSGHSCATPPPPLASGEVDKVDFAHLGSLITGKQIGRQDRRDGRLIRGRGIQRLHGFGAAPKRQHRGAVAITAHDAAGETDLLAEHGQGHFAREGFIGLGATGLDPGFPEPRDHELGPSDLMDVCRTGQPSIVSR